MGSGFGDAPALLAAGSDECRGQVETAPRPEEGVSNGTTSRREWGYDVFLGASGESDEAASAAVSPEAGASGAASDGCSRD